MKIVRHKGNIFYLTALLFLMTSSGVKSAWHHSLGSVLFGGFKYIINQDPTQEKTGAAPSPPEFCQTHLSSNIPPLLEPEEVLTIQFSTQNHLHKSIRETHRTSWNGRWICKRLVLPHDVSMEVPKSLFTSLAHYTIIIHTFLLKYFFNSYFKDSHASLTVHTLSTFIMLSQPVLDTGLNIGEEGKRKKVSLINQPPLLGGAIAASKVVNEAIYFFFQLMGEHIGSTHPPLIRLSFPCELK